MRSDLQTAIPGFSDKWQPVQCKTPTGQSLEWQHIAGTTGQEFYFVTAEGKEEYRSTEANLEFFSREEDGKTLIIGWRVPADVRKHIGPPDDRGLDNWAARVPGSVAPK